MQSKHDVKMDEAALLYAYGELPQSEEKAFLEHLKTCSVCQNTIKATNLLNAALPQIKAPESLDTVPYAKPKKSWFSLPRFNFNLRLLTPLGAAAVITVMAIGFYQTAAIYSAQNQAAAESSIDAIYDSLYTLEDETEDLISYIDNL